MHLLNLLAALAAATPVVSQATTAPTPPNLTLLYTMNAVIGDRFSLGRVPSGEERVVVPIIGGTFEGRMMKGTVLNLGADWRLADSGGVLRPDARYGIRTDDGVDIYVQTEGYPLADGQTILRGRFETGLTALDGKYAWLNDVLGVGFLRNNGTRAVTIEMWHAHGAVHSHD